MDAITKIRLHPGAKDFLFANYVTLRRIFSDVLGQLEIDYISIALINKHGKIFFLSSNPSIEQNLIEKGLWEHDGAYQANFIHQNQPKLWSEFLNNKYSEPLRQYKQKNPKLVEGISIPMEYENYKAVLSFGFRQINPNVQNKTPTFCKKLLALSKYCLRDIRCSISLPGEKKYPTTKPKFELIINNQVTS